MPFSAHTTRPPTNSTTALATTVCDIQQWTDPQLTHSLDRASSGSASPTTPFDHQSMDKNRFEETLRGLFSYTDMSAIDQKSCQHQSRLRSLSLCVSPSIMPSTPFDEHNLHTPPKNRTMPETTVGRPLNSASTPPREEVAWSGDTPKDYSDTFSITGNDSLYSVGYKDFPNPPSSTPSLTIQTSAAAEEAIYDHHPAAGDTFNLNSVCTTSTLPFMYPGCLGVSRFKEVFDLDTIEGHHSYQQQQHPQRTKRQIQQVDKHNGRWGDFIASIGRTTSPSSPSLSSSSSRQSLRRLIRSVSSTATNQHSKKVSANKEDDDGRSVNSSSSSNHRHPIAPCIEQPSCTQISNPATDERRRNVATFLYDVIRRSPSLHQKKTDINDDQRQRRPLISTRRTHDPYTNKKPVSSVPSLTRSTTTTSPKSSASSSISSASWGTAKADGHRQSSIQLLRDDNKGGADGFSLQKTLPSLPSSEC